MTLTTCQIKLYDSILARLEGRGVRLAEVLAKLAPPNKREWLLKRDGIRPRPTEDVWATTPLFPLEHLIKFLSNIDIRAEEDCWEFGGYCNPYGQLYVCRNLHRAHVLMYDLWYGLPENYGGRTRGCLVVRHKCDNPPCCNPEHLEIGTIAENISDAVSRKRHYSVALKELKAANSIAI